MQTYEADPTVPFWRSDIDVADLFEEHVLPPNGYSEKLLLDADYPEMRGRFELLISNERAHHWTFTPGAGDERAVVIPIYDDAEMVDVLTVGDETVWGCVTGRGLTIGSADTGRVYKSAWQWLLFDQDGILILDKSAYATLNTGQQLLAEGLDHADEIAHRVFVEPAFYDKQSRCLNYQAADAAELIARDLVGVDNDRYDVASDIRDRVILEAKMKLRKKGVIPNGNRYAA